jgi:hypothetical protein
MRYTRSVADTYRTFSRFIVEKEMSLDYVYLASENDSDIDLPSWVPELQASAFPVPLFVEDDLKLQCVPTEDDRRRFREISARRDEAETQIQGC